MQEKPFFRLLMLCLLLFVSGNGFAKTPLPGIPQPPANQPRVQKWIELLTTNQAYMDFFVQSYARGQQVIPTMLPIIRQNGLPDDVIYIAFAESGFQQGTKSWASAYGYWQFIASTAEYYGLKTGGGVGNDERTHLGKSTNAACRYLRDLYEIYDNWYLAMAAYNSGEDKTNSAIRTANSRDFWQLNGFKMETMQYVPKILAIRIIAQNPRGYGFDLEPLNLQTIEPQDLVFYDFKTGRYKYRVQQHDYIYNIEQAVIQGLCNIDDSHRKLTDWDKFVTYRDIIAWNTSLDKDLTLHPGTTLFVSAPKE